MKELFLNILFVASLIKICSSENTVEVKINQGAVLGRIEKTLFGKREYYAFRGVPYAAPPLNELRFQPPAPHGGWEETLEALENKPTCMQFSSRLRNNEPFGVSGSEDCLHLSVFTPNLKGKAPIIVFDYNDQFRTGFNGTDTYSPDNFIDEEVLTVTINHRLGFLGYLTTEDGVIPGNNGLRDFIFGLQWIKDNIENFGGDPERVTLMGSCSGGALVNMLLYSEKAKGLFNRAIIQSGSAFEKTYFSTEARSHALEFAASLNISTTDSATILEGLQKADINALFQEEVTVISNFRNDKDSQSTFQLFTPVIEKGYSDVVLDSLPEESKIVNDVPVIIGLNSKEGIDYLSHFFMNPLLLPTTAEDKLVQFPVRTDFRFDPDSSAYKKANIEIRDFYIESKNLDYGSIPEYAVLAADSLTGYALNFAAKSLARNLESPVYYYYFDFKGQVSENSRYLMSKSRYVLGAEGATVGDELCYLHICVRVKRYYETLREMISEQHEIKVMKKMVKMWTNFAKLGNPTPSQDNGILKGISWEPIKKDIDQLNYLHITKQLKMKTNPLGEREKFWDDFIEKYSELAVDGVVKIEEREEL